MDFLKNKFVTTGIMIAVVVGLGYYVWTSSSSSPLLTTAGETSPLSENILTTLTQLNTITLDDALFKDPVFQSLSDFGVTIPCQDAGRNNPFAPVNAAELQNPPKCQQQ